MSSQGFSFPPPPPPPSQQSQSSYPSASQYGQNYGHRGGRGGYQRGRGRGIGNRGGGRGVHYGASDVAHTQPYSTNPAANYAQMNYGYAAQGLPTHTPGNMPASQYPQSQASGFRAPTPAFSPQSYSQPGSHMPPSPCQHQPGYNAAYNSSNMPHQTNSYPTHTASSYPTMTQHAHPSQPPMMGPPMHWGYPANTGTYPGSQYGNAGGQWGYNPYGNQAHGGGKGPKHPAKRDHTSAFGKPRSTAPRTPAPPAVPSFGNPLPSKPPPPVDSRKPRKKKRKHNQLGLTPKADEHESSEEEDDADEESRLADGGGATAALKFTYRGRTSTLQSPADIAAWIEERKKRFPTQARIEERKKTMEEAKKAREEANRQRELQRQESRRLQREAREQKEREKQEQQEKSSNPANAAAKAKQKADKLRRKLMKEEKRVAKAEAHAERARLQTQSVQNHSTNGTEDAAESHAAVAEVGDGAPGATLPVNQQETIPEPHGITTLPPQPDQTAHTETLDAHPGISSDASESSDWTSSSGSDLSDSEESGSDYDDAESDSSAPEETTSRRTAPDRVPLPPREPKKRICRHFARNGRCLRGENCNFRHEMPERSKGRDTEKKGRKGLLQALLDRQKEDEDRRVMEAIMVLGERGLLDPKPGETDG